MSVTAARIAAAEIMKDLRAGRLLDSAFEKRATVLDHRDRRWVQELVWSVLRNRERYDRIIGNRVRGGLSVLDPDVLDVLRLGVHQLLAMDSVPPWAAISESVEAVKTGSPQRSTGKVARKVAGEPVRNASNSRAGAAKLVNAVLRRVDRERSELEREVLADAQDQCERLSIEYSHPLWQVERWVDQWGVPETEKFLALNNTQAPVVIRPHAISANQLASSLQADGVRTTAHHLAGESLVIEGPVNLTAPSAFKQGGFFVQDPAATLVVQYAHIDPGCTVADLCAAPGGKTLELARKAGRVIAADRSRVRVARMRSGFERLGEFGRAESDCLNDRIAVVVSDATMPCLVSADAVLVDVPCTGTGTFRRHPDARWRLQISDFAVMPAVQRKILEAAASIVKPGGLLIYSTCSVEPEENDENIDSFLVSHPEFVLEPPPAGVVPQDTLDKGRLRILPQRHGSDGAFAARLRRTT